jgi:hypothetical protein
MGVFGGLEKLSGRINASPLLLQNSEGPLASLISLHHSSIMHNCRQQRRQMSHIFQDCWRGHHPKLVQCGLTPSGVPGIKMFRAR